MRSELCARCIRCGDFVSLDPDEYGNCQCGAIHHDRDAGRFGSSRGDDQIEIYRCKPGRRHTAATLSMRDSRQISDVGGY
jgi:hypothetical protein